MWLTLTIVRDSETPVPSNTTLERAKPSQTEKMVMIWAVFVHLSGDDRKLLSGQDSGTVLHVMDWALIHNSKRKSSKMANY